MSDYVSNEINEQSGIGETDRAQQWAELGVFLFLIIPSMIIDLFVFRQQLTGFATVAWATMARDLALVALILYFVWRSGETSRAVGWRFRGRLGDLALGVVLFVPFFFFSGLVGDVFAGLGLSTPSKPLPSGLTARGPWEFVLATVLVAVVAVSEETIFRGYLILRFKKATGSMGWAVVLSSIVFAMGHGYEGSAGVATVGVMGVVFALVYIWRKSLVAPIVIHFLTDFLAIVLVPLLALR